LFTRRPLRTRNWQIFTLMFWNSQVSLLAPSDYWLFHNLKKHLKRRKFSSTEVTLAEHVSFAAQLKDFFWMSWS
jgi:hypothetical protein